LKTRKNNDRNHQLKSPVDGSIFAPRPVSTDHAVNAAVKRAKAAQVSWAQAGRRSCTFILAVLEALVGMSDEIVPKIAWKMGRPVLCGKRSSLPISL